MPSFVRSFRLRSAALAAAALSLTLLAACADAPTAVRPTSVSPVAVNASIAGSLAIAAPVNGHALACAAVAADSASAIIGPRGGVVGVNGSAMLVPPGAVPHPTAFTFVVPSSPLVEIEVHPAGGGHYAFKRPVVMTVSYARCSTSELPSSSVGAWWIDSSTQQQLGVMAGIDDRDHRRLTFFTDHLSGYLVAY